jgi:hypothetical protein
VHFPELFLAKTHGRIPNKDATILQQNLSPLVRLRQKSEGKARLFLSGDDKNEHLYVTGTVLLTHSVVSAGPSFFQKMRVWRHLIRKRLRLLSAYTTLGGNYPWRDFHPQESCHARQ